MTPTMMNLMLFAVTAIVYLSVWCEMQRDSLAVYAKRAVLVALLCAPYNINGDVYTVLGNAVSENDIHGVCSLYQRADWQATNVIGLLGYQSGYDAVKTYIGIPSYQSSERGGVVTYLGLGIYQRAGEKSRAFGALDEMYDGGYSSWWSRLMYGD